MKYLASVALLACAWGCAPPPDEVEVESRPIVVEDTSVAVSGVPGGVYTDRGPILSYTGTDGRINVLTPREPESTWDKIVLPETTLGGTSLQIGPDGHLYLAWVGSDRLLNVMRSSDSGRSWTNKVTFGFGSTYHSDQPASLVRWRSTLCLFAVAERNIADGIVHRWEFINGSWVGPLPMTDVIHHLFQVSTSRFGSGELLMSMNIDLEMIVRRFNAGGRWDGQGRISLANGTLMERNGRAIAVTRNLQSPNRDRVEAYETSDGMNFTRIVSTNHFTNELPIGISATLSSFTFAHIGTDPARRLNFTTVPR